MSNPELQEIALPQLLPIQSIIDPSKFRGFIGPHLPIDAVLYDGNDGDRARYLLVDGHHRAYREFEVGQQTLWAYVYTESGQFQASSAPVLKAFGTMDAVRDMYDRKWQNGAAKSVSELLFNIWD